MSNSTATTATSAVELMSEGWRIAHGRAGCRNWTKPALVVKSNLQVRPDQHNEMAANEYVDSPDVLDKKIDLFIDLLKASK
jgi:hypothetical protein